MRVYVVKEFESDYNEAYGVFERTVLVSTSIEDAVRRVHEHVDSFGKVKGYNLRNIVKAETISDTGFYKGCIASCDIDADGTQYHLQYYVESVMDVDGEIV